MSGQFDKGNCRFEQDSWIPNPCKTVEETVAYFRELIEDFKYISLQKWYDPEPSSELVTVRKVDDLYLIGNTFIADEVRLNCEPVVLAGHDHVLVDFNRIEIVDNWQLKIYLTKLIEDWVDEISCEGSYFEEGKSEEKETEEILHNMMFWSEANPKWTTYDPNDKVNAVWLSQYKTQEDRENLLKEKVSE